MSEFDAFSSSSDSDDHADNDHQDTVADHAGNPDDEIVRAPLNPNLILNSGTSNTRGDWTEINNHEVTVEINSLDLEALLQARDEITTFLNRVKSHLGILGSLSSLKFVSVAQLAKMWFPSHILSLFVSRINLGLTYNSKQKLNNNDEFWLWMQTEFLLMFYNVSPTEFYGTENRSLFPLAGKAIAFARYMEILRALQIPDREICDWKNGGDNCTWLSPMKRGP
jgi:hypothetical protein